MTLPAQSSFPDFHDAPLQAIQLDLSSSVFSLFVKDYNDQAGEYEHVTIKFSGIEELELPKAPKGINNHAEIYDITLEENEGIRSAKLIILFDGGPSWEISFFFETYTLISGWPA